MRKARGFFFCGNLNSCYISWVFAQIPVAGVFAVGRVIISIICTGTIVALRHLSVGKLVQFWIWLSLALETSLHGLLWTPFWDSVPLYRWTSRRGGNKKGKNIHRCAVLTRVVVRSVDLLMCVQLGSITSAMHFSPNTCACGYIGPRCQTYRSSSILLSCIMDGCKYLWTQKLWSKCVPRASPHLLRNRLCILALQILHHILPWLLFSTGSYSDCCCRNSRCWSTCQSTLDATKLRSLLQHRFIYNFLSWHILVLMKYIGHMFLSAHVHKNCAGPMWHNC